MTPEEAMFQEAMSAVHSGDRTRARDLFTRLLKTDQGKIDYWLWMSAVVDTAKERSYCLNEVLRRDPENVAARRGLQMLGQATADESQVIPFRLQKRNWQAADIPSTAERPPLPLGGWRQWALILGALVVFAAIVVVAVLGTRRVKQARIIIPTDFPIVATFTPSVTPTVVHLAVTTPTFAGPTPLWMQLKATYTPTPLYVNTPHPMSEAYRIGMRAFERGDYTGMANYMLQVLTVEPAAPDVLYYSAEASRLQGDTEKAVSIYNRIIQADPGFAPAYLGRARAHLAGNQKADSIIQARADLEIAVQKDPNLAEAYLELAQLDISEGNFDTALERLDTAAPLLPGSPLVALYRAQVYLGLDKPAQALTEAQAANQLDFTLLPAYRVLCEALQANGRASEAIEPIKTYLQYVNDDPGAYVLAARSYAAIQEPESAIDMLTNALKLNNNFTSAYLERAQIHLEMQNYDSAVDDFRQASKLNKESYPANLGLGKALFMGQYAGDAYMQFQRTRGLAKTDAQTAEVIYWEAQALEKLGKPDAAYGDWQELLALPPESVRAQWSNYARQRLAALATPTHTAVPSATPRPSATAAPTSTRVTATPPAASRTPTPTR